MRLLSALVTLVIATGALATEKNPPKTPTPVDPSVEVHTTATPKAESASDSASEASSRSTSRSGSSGVKFSSDFDSLALELPSVTAAPSVGGHECLVHKRGYAPIPGTGASGKTEFDANCLALQDRAEKHAQMMERARLLIELGDTNGARAELGLPPVALTPTSAVPTTYSPCEPAARAELIACRQREAGFPDVGK